MVSYPRVLVLGDSLASGRDASLIINAFDRLIVSALQARNNGSAIDYLVHGVGGIQTGQMLANLQSFGLLPPISDLLIVELGTNDFGHNVPLAQFQSDLSNLCAFLLTGSPRPAALVLLTPWYDPAAVNANGNTAQQFRDAVVNESMELAMTYTSVKVSAVDIGAICVTPGTHPINTAIDTFHPNDYGHELIAQDVLAVI